MNNTIRISDWLDAHQSKVWSTLYMATVDRFTKMGWPVDRQVSSVADIDSGYSVDAPEIVLCGSVVKTEIAGMKFVEPSNHRRGE